MKIMVEFETEIAQTDVDILALSKKYTPSIFPSETMIALGCSFCDKIGEEEVFGVRSQIQLMSMGIIMTCEDHVKDAKEIDMLYIASMASFPADPLYGIKINYRDEEWDVYQMRVSRNLSPNSLILACYKNGYVSNPLCKKLLEKNREVLEKIRDIVKDYDNPHYPTEMQDAFYTKLNNLFVRDSLETVSTVTQ